MTLTELRTELQTDPTALGYAPSVAAGRDQSLADTLNLVRVTITIRRSDVSAKELWEAIDLTDHVTPVSPASPTPQELNDERWRLAWLSGLPNLGAVRLQNDDGTNGPVVTNLSALFKNPSSTRTRIVALATRTGSRAEQLWGAGIIITAEQVGRALR